MSIEKREWVYPLKVNAYGSNLDDNGNAFLEVADGKNRPCFYVRVNGRERNVKESLEKEIVPLIVDVLNRGGDVPVPVIEAGADTPVIDAGQFVRMVARVGDEHKDRGVKKKLTYPMFIEICKDFWDVSSDDDKMLMPRRDEVVADA